MRFVPPAGRACPRETAARCGSSPVPPDPHGDILADAGDAEGFISARLDLAALENYRNELPFLADMRGRPAGQNA